MTEAQQIYTEAGHVYDKDYYNALEDFRKLSTALKRGLREIRDIKNIIQNLTEEKLKGNIAFQADIGPGPISNLAVGNVVSFGVTKLNEGYAYDARSGRFTAPMDGLYHFDWSILINENGVCQTELVVDGRTYGQNHCRGGKDYMQCSKAAEVRLTKGQKVWIRTFRRTCKFVDRAMSSFSGHIVYFTPQ